jgi:hypothetical protein
VQTAGEGEGLEVGMRIGEDAAGELYVVTMSPDQIRKVVPAPR